MNRKQAKLLLLVADKLEHLKKNQVFDISEWGKKTSCGTTCCVLGWAGLIPKCQEHGLKTEIGKGGTKISFKGDYFATSDCTNDEVEAGATAFGLTPEEAELLFIPHDDRDIKDLGFLPDNSKEQGAAEGIRKVVAFYFPIKAVYSI